MRYLLALLLLFSLNTLAATPPSISGALSAVAQDADDANADPWNPNKPSSLPARLMATLCVCAGQLRHTTISTAIKSVFRSSNRKELKRNSRWQKARKRTMRFWARCEFFMMYWNWMSPCRICSPVRRSNSISASRAALKPESAIHPWKNWWN